MQVQTFYQQIATGCILLLAVGLGRLREMVERAVWSRPQHNEGRGAETGTEFTATAVNLTGGE
jgi:hypothetical protein